MPRENYAHTIGGFSYPTFRRLLMIDFSCTKCGKLFHLKPEFAGRATTCSGCKQSLIVPTPVAHATGSPSPSPGSPSPSPVAHAPGSPIDKIAFSCAKCGMKFSVKQEFAGRATKCPTCKEMLKVPSADQTQAVAPSRGKLAGTASSLAQAGMDGGMTLAGEASTETSHDLLRNLIDSKGNDGARYIVESEIARGGMGAVLRAVDCDIRREVAVKYLLDQADAKKKLRFVEEAQITGQLEHPNIVPIHELGIDAQKRVFFSMKMVKGRSLAEILNVLRTDPINTSKDYSLSKLLGIFNSICNGLAYAHSRGVVHRDLKPANIMIGDFGEVYVMDWGLAKVIRRGLSTVNDVIPDGIPVAEIADAKTSESSPFEFTTDAPTAPRLTSGSASGSSSGSSHSSQIMTNRELDADLTQEGAVLGTPVYMPPEQALGHIHEIDERSDIYAMGAILYEMITLQPPISKEGGYWPVLMRVTRGEIVPPEKKAPERAKAGLIPVELAAVAMKALAMNKEARYQSIERLRRDIDLFIEGRSVSAKQDTPKEQIIKFIKRNQGFSIATASGLLILFFVMAFFLRVNYSARVFAEQQQKKAEQSKQDLLKEQGEKQNAIKHALPALVSSARQLAGDGLIAEAENQLKLALLYDSQNAPARLLKGQLLIANESWAEGRAELDLYRKLRPKDYDAEFLVDLCERGQAKEASAWFELARYLQDQKLAMPAMQLLQKAQRAAKSQEPLLALYRKQIESQWPGAGYLLGLNKGLLSMGWASSQTPSAAVEAANLDLLKGIPLDRINVTGMKKLRDLSALRDMPLTDVSISSSPEIRDLEPLRRLKLRKLTLSSSTSIRNLEPLRGMKLTHLNVGSTLVSDLSPLQGMPLQVLNLRSCPTVKNLAPLRDMPLQDLSLNGLSEVTTLEPLRGMPLVHLDITGCHKIQDLTPLTGMKLTVFDFGGIKTQENAEVIRGMPLETVNASVFRDISALEGMKLRRIYLNLKNLPKGVEVIRKMESLQLINGSGVNFTPEEFWKRYDAKEFK